MRRRTDLILIALTTFLAACSGATPVVSPRVCPPYPEMPEAAKLYLQEVATVDPDGDGPEPRHPSPGSESLWNWLSDVTVLRQQLQACR
ncbi:MAG TPA: hypothetical protein VFE11_17430 [Dongiaceae bacterium]|jgi:hypothetical protein|nr:hypothetical protein [Dongiaceae bacterium]